MLSKLTGNRKTDALLSVAQNNNLRVLEIKEVNDRLEAITGLKATEMVGKSLETLLPETINETVREYVEFEEGANDVGTVLSRIRDFAILDKTGGSIPLNLKVLRGEPLDGHDLFVLILRDLRLQNDLDKVREILAANFKGHEIIDEATGLPNRISFLKDLEMVSYYVQTRGLTACIAMVDVDAYDDLLENQGEAPAKALLRSVGMTLKHCLRSDDTVGVLSGRTLGVVLVEADKDASTMVLNRLRQSVSNHPITLPNGTEMTPMISIGFTHLNAKSNLESVLATCESALAKAAHRGGNCVQEG